MYIKFLLIGKHELIFDEKVQINASTVIKLTHQQKKFQQNINIKLPARFYMHFSTSTTIINIQIAEFFYYYTVCIFLKSKWKWFVKSIMRYFLSHFGGLLFSLLVSFFIKKFKSQRNEIRIKDNIHKNWVYKWFFQFNL